MSNEEKLKKIMASYCPVPYPEIDLSDIIKDTYVPAEEKEPFADDICNKWQLTNQKCTDLHNRMFDTLKTGKDILNFL